jgi:hypothetical protein
MCRVSCVVSCFYVWCVLKVVSLCTVTTSLTVLGSCYGLVSCSWRRVVCGCVGVGFGVKGDARGREWAGVKLDGDGRGGGMELAVRRHVEREDMTFCSRVGCASYVQPGLSFRLPPLRSVRSCVCAFLDTCDCVVCVCVRCPGALPVDDPTGEPTQAKTLKRHKDFVMVRGYVGIRDGGSGGREARGGERWTWCFSSAVCCSGCQVTESFGKSTDGGTVRKAVIFHAKDGRLSVATSADKTMGMTRVGSSGKNQLKVCVTGVCMVLGCGGPLGRGEQGGGGAFSRGLCLLPCGAKLDITDCRSE